MSKSRVSQPNMVIGVGLASVIVIAVLWFGVFAPMLSPSPSVIVQSIACSGDGNAAVVSNENCTVIYYIRNPNNNIAPQIGATLTGTQYVWSSNIAIGRGGNYGILTFYNIPTGVYTLRTSASDFNGNPLLGNGCTMTIGIGISAGPAASISKECITS